MSRVKKIWKKILTLSLVLIMTTTLSSCTYTDLDHLLFVSSMVLDYDEEKDEVVVYFETLKPVRSPAPESNTAERILFKESAVTVSQAIQRFRAQTSSTINFNHTKIISFSEKLAKRGFKDFFDIFDREQEFNNRTYLAVYDGDVEEIIKTELPEEELHGLFFYNLITNNENISPQGTQVTLRDFFNMRYTGTHISPLPCIIYYDKEINDQKLMVSGLSFIKDYTLVSTMESFYVLYLNLMCGEISRDTLTVVTPNDEKSLITTSIVKNKSKKDYDYRDGKLYATYNIKIYTVLAEGQNNLKYNTETVKQIEQMSENKVKNIIYEMFDKYKEHSLDIFGLQDDFDRKFPNADVENVIDITEIQINVDVHLEGSPKTDDYY